MRHVFVTPQHHHSSWHVHLLDCVTDSIQTDHHDQLDVPFQVFEGGAIEDKCVFSLFDD